MYNTHFTDGKTEAQRCQSLIFAKLLAHRRTRGGSLGTFKRVPQNSGIQIKATYFLFFFSV